ncbi:MAG TPA: hypothetical protein VGH70_11965 [Bradyrhizobium sp.]|jgi:hypothetical protein
MCHKGLLDTFHGCYSANNVDSKPSGNAKVIAIRLLATILSCRPAAIDKAQNRASPKVVFDRLVGAMRADA